jgi:hypothetical protein
MVARRWAELRAAVLPMEVLQTAVRRTLERIAAARPAAALQAAALRAARQALQPVAAQALRPADPAAAVRVGFSLLASAASSVTSFGSPK